MILPVLFVICWLIYDWRKSYLIEKELAKIKAELIERIEHNDR